MPQVIRFRDYERKSQEADAVHRFPADSAVIILLPTEFNVAHIRREIDDLMKAETKR